MSADMSAPLRDHLRRSSIAGGSSIAGSPPASPRAPLSMPVSSDHLQHPQHSQHPHVHHSGPPPSSPRRTLSSPAVGASTAIPPPTTGSANTNSTNQPTSSPSFPVYGRHNSAAQSLRTQTITRISGGTSSFSTTTDPTPRTRLARGGPPRASVRTRRRGPRRGLPRYPPDPPTLVRYHWSTIILLVLYLPLLIIPWVIVCVLDVKPLVLYGKSYQSTGWYTPTDIAWVPRWVRASNILACFSAALAFPLVTAVMAHASVAFVQNTKRPGSQSAVNARQLLSLADGCWVRVAGDRRMWLAKAGTTMTVLSECPVISSPLSRFFRVLPRSHVFVMTAKRLDVLFCMLGNEHSGPT